ncbi:MAG: hypothetical protein JHC33_04800 [Ignisphaera sp.]|nr:hypothetical protein [Ignisphaera sp.]
MNHYKWIVLKIQDLSSSDFIHSVTYPEDEDAYAISAKPMSLFVNADDMEALLRAKEIMEAACNSIYEVLVETADEDEDEDSDRYFATKVMPAYIDNFLVENMKVKELLLANTIQKAKRQKKAAPNYYEQSRNFKKIHKNRFQVFQYFEGGDPIEIELFNEQF